MASLPSESQETQMLLDRLESGDEQALDELLSRHRDLVRRFVDLRLEPQLRARIDASDVIQEAQMEIARRMAEFLEKKPMPFRLWVRQTAYENLIRLRRKHVGAEKRSVNREVWLPDRSSVLLVQQLMGGGPAPDQNMLDEEMAVRVRRALAELPDTDREVLLMRTFDGLSNNEVAAILNLDASGASKRYGRALLRLRKFLS